jgi:hypothetical protein
MDRVFLDANLLFSAAYSALSRLRELWSRHNATLLSSEFALEEARRNLEIYGADPAQELKRLAARLEIVPDVSGSSLALPGADLPEGDRALLSAAVLAECSHFLTGDKRHFGPLYERKVGGVLVLTPGQYLRGDSPRQHRRRA